MKTFDRLLMFGFFIIVVSALNVNAQIENGADIAGNQQDFFLVVNPMQLCDNEVCPGTPCNPGPGYQFRNIWGNLFTFTHPQTPSQGKIIEWNVDTNKSGKLASGSFTIEVEDLDFNETPPACWPPQSPRFMYGHINGKIFIKLEVQVEPVPRLGDPTEPQAYNFQGPIQIIGGEGFYEGIKGSGTVSGTYNDFPGDVGGIDRTSIFFVITGKAKF